MINISPTLPIKSHNFTRKKDERLDIRGRELRRDSSLTLRMTNKPTVLAE